MNDRQAFSQEAATQILPAYVERLEADYEMNRIGHYTAIKSKIREFLDVYPPADEGHLHLSWLRSSFFAENKLEYTLELYSDQYYHDWNKKEAVFSYDWLLPYLQDYKKDLEKLAQVKYPLVIPELTERELFRGFDVFQEYFKACMRSGIEDEWFGAPLRIGEYHSVSEAVGKQGVLKNPQIDKIIKNPERYSGISVENVRQKKKEFKSANLSFLRFKDCDFSEGNFEQSILYGTRFENCRMENCSFALCYLHDSSFASAICTGSVFRAVEGDRSDGLARIPSYHGVNFTNAVLRDCDFRFAHIRGADFSGADMKRALFLRKQIDDIDLTESQKAEIRLAED